MSYNTPPHCFPFFPPHPGIAPMPPAPCPPPPPRHPDLFGDADGYTRKEVDELVDRKVAAGIGSARDAASAAQSAAEEAQSAAEEARSAVTEVADGVAHAEASASAAQAAAAEAAETAAGIVFANNGLVVIDGVLWYFSDSSTDVDSLKWKKFKAPSSVPAQEFSKASANSIVAADGVVSFETTKCWSAKANDGGTYFAGVIRGTGDSDGIKFYYLSRGGEYFVYSTTVYDIDVISFNGKLFAEYKPSGDAGFHWTDAPYRVKVADVAFANSFDRQS